MSRKEDDSRVAVQEDAELKKLLGDDEPQEPKNAIDPAHQEILNVLSKLLDGFLNTQDEVVKQSNENRAGLQDEIDCLHKVLVGVPGQVKPARDCELETLAKLRQIQTDQTANRVHLMDSASRMIGALKYLLKDGVSKKSKGDGDLRKMLGDGENV